MLLYIVWGVQKTQNLTKEYTYRVRTLIWPFYFNLDICALRNSQHQRPQSSAIFTYVEGNFFSPNTYLVNKFLNSKDAIVETLHI